MNSNCAWLVRYCASNWRTISFAGSSLPEHLNQRQVQSVEAFTRIVAYVIHTASSGDLVTKRGLAQSNYSFAAADDFKTRRCSASIIRLSSLISASLASKRSSSFWFSPWIAASATPSNSSVLMLLSSRPG